MLVNVVKALVTMGEWEEVHGLSIWCQMRTGTKPLWIQGAEAQAKGRYDQPLREGDGGFLTRTVGSVSWCCSLQL